MCVSATFGAFDHTISNTYYYGILTLNGESLLVTGAGANGIEAEGLSYVEIQNTASLQNNVGGIYTLDLEDNSILNYFGGETGNFDIYDDATAVFSGGRIDYISSFQRPLSGDYPPSYWDKHIEIICKSYDYNTSTKKLTGVWGNDTTFNIQLVDKSGYYSAISNIEFTIIPEPATLSLLGLGGLLIRRKLK
jgi:hypothetical protein